MASTLSGNSTATGIALAMIALLAVLTVVCMLVGARKKRERVAAERIELERIAAEAAPVVTAPARPLRDDDALDVPAAAPAPPPVAPPPVAPAPPPLADLPDVVAPPEPQPEPAVDGPARLADEPIAAAAPLDASPAAQAQEAPEPPPPADPGPPPGDAPVTRIKGLGPKVAARLAELDIATVGDLAALDQRAAEDLDARLGPFTGRLSRDRWLEQAQLLARGDVKTFEARFGKL